MTYLKQATDFTDMVKKKKHKELKLTIECPVCKGYGGWNLRLNAYGPQKHFRAHCFQCNGWGYVDKEDLCIHDFIELSQKNMC